MGIWVGPPVFYYKEYNLKTFFLCLGAHVQEFFHVNVNVPYILVTQKG